MAIHGNPYRYSYFQWQVLRDINLLPQSTAPSYLFAASEQTALHALPLELAKINALMFSLYSIRSACFPFTAVAIYEAPSSIHTLRFRCNQQRYLAKLLGFGHAWISIPLKMLKS